MDLFKRLTRREAVKKVGTIPLIALLTPPVASGQLPGITVTEKIPQTRSRISLNPTTIVVAPDETSFVLHAVKDLAEYLGEYSPSPIPVKSKLAHEANVTIAVGRTVLHEILPGITGMEELGDEGFRIMSVLAGGKVYVIVSGLTSRGTNCGLATLMQRIRFEENSPYLEGPLEISSKPRFALRGIHLNGWPLKNPYSFRTWQEKDWQRFIDLTWLQKGNLFFLWPFMEIMPVPLSPADEAYLQEVRRVVEYAQKQRGMEVWIMHSANRIATSDCGVHDPKTRLYWVDECQKDMNPADPIQVEKIMGSLEVFYRTVNNADGYCMIDSDPGGWPQSPISEQVKIFQRARALLDRYHVNGNKATLIDWMWVGWGRHKFFSPSKTVVSQYDWTSQNPDASDLAFMGDTIRNFKQNLAEPWSLIAGFSPYLDTCRKEGVLEKTVFLPYGVIEVEPAFPSTRVSLNSIRSVFDFVQDLSELRGVMGNNQTPLLQLPRTFFFLSAAWELDYKNRSEREVLQDLSEQLYPQNSNFIAECFLALEDNNSNKIDDLLGRLQTLLTQGKIGRPGALGRKLFPDPIVVAKSLVFQLKIRAARERFLQALTGEPTRSMCEVLIVDYLGALLSWSQETGWEGIVIIGTWRGTMYQSDKRFTEALSILKRILGEGSSTTHYAAIASFFDSISRRLREKYGEDEVMMSCVEPLKLAVIQAP